MRGNATATALAAKLFDLFPHDIEGAVLPEDLNYVMSVLFESNEFEHPVRPFEAKQWHELLSSAYETLGKRILELRLVDLCKVKGCKDQCLPLPLLVIPARPGNGALEKLDTGHGLNYGWIRYANDEDVRTLRRLASWETLAACAGGGYRPQGIDNERTVLLSAQTTVNGTRTVAGGVDEAHLKPSKPPSVTHARGFVFDVALQRAREGALVACVNASSAYHCGGGFLTGGRHALEEAMCMQSTLYPSLQRAASDIHQEVFVDGQMLERHIPLGGAILSPDVQVFRGGSNEGYPFFDSAVKLAGVVSVAAPNKNPEMGDSPVDAPKDHKEYNHLLQQTFLAALNASVECGATEMVIPDVGCGVFHNDPKDVGKALGSAISIFRGKLEQVLICGRRSFFEACASELGIDANIVKNSEVETSNRPQRTCKHGCGRPPFRHFPTCCTSCHGPGGPHSHSCDSAVGVDSKAPTHELNPGGEASPTTCKHGCERPRFRHYPTCCTSCCGPSGPHSHSCDSAAGAPKGRSATCQRGCGRAPFKHYPTCCTRCKGPEGPHHSDCDLRQP